MCWQDTVIGRQGQAKQIAVASPTPVTVPPNPSRLSLLVYGDGGPVQICLGPTPTTNGRLMTLQGDWMHTLTVRDHGQIVTGAICVDVLAASSVYVAEIEAPFLPPTGPGLEGIGNWG